MTEGPGIGQHDWPWLLSLLLVACLVLAAFALYTYRFTADAGGVPLDDAWIHFQFARNLARGDGLSFNPGHPTAGSTAPLWTLLLAGAYRAGGRFPLGAQWLSGTSFVAVLAATYWLGKRLTGSRWSAWLAGTVVATNGRMAWAGLAALETCLFAALSLLAIGAQLKDRAAGRLRFRTVTLFGLAALSRPEGYLLFVLALADFLLALVASDGEPWRVRWRRLPLLPAAVFGAIVLPYLLFSLRTSGHLLPNTYHAKATFVLQPDLDFLSLAARYLILDNPLLLPFFVLGAASLLRRARLLSLWSVGLPAVYAFAHAALYQHGRYLMPLIPCNALIGVVGLREAHRLATQRGLRWPHSQTVAAALVSVLVIAGTAYRLPAMARQYAKNVDEINHVHVAIGRWVAQNTPPDALLALNDIGAISYVSQRPVVDLAGLVTPEVIPLLRHPDRDSLLAEYLAGQDVQYVIIFPDWFPGLASRSDVLEPVHQVTLEHRTIAGGESLVVYRAHWRR